MRHSMRFCVVLYKFPVRNVRGISDFIAFRALEMHWITQHTNYVIQLDFPNVGCYECNFISCFIHLNFSVEYQIKCESFTWKMDSTQMHGMELNESNEQQNCHEKSFLRFR